MKRILLLFAVVAVTLCSYSSANAQLPCQEVVIGHSYYDVQTNGCIQQRIIRGADYIEAAWTMSQEPTFMETFINIVKKMVCMSFYLLITLKILMVLNRLKIKSVFNLVYINHHLMQFNAFREVIGIMTQYHQIKFS